MVRIPLGPLRLTDYTRLTSPLSPHKRKSGSSSGSGTTASSRTSSSSSSSVAPPSGDASSEASANTSTRGTRLSSTMASSLLPSPFGTTTTSTPPVSRGSSESGRPLKTLYEAPRPSSSSAARAMAHEDEQADEQADDDDDSPDELVAQTTRAATTPPRRLMDLFLSSAAKEGEASISGSRGHSPRSPQPRSRTRSEPGHLSPARNAARASATSAPAPTSKDEEIAATPKPAWSFYEDPVEPTPVASTTSNGANDPTLDAEADQAEYHDENVKPSPTSLARQMRRRSLNPIEAPRLMPSPPSMTFPSAPGPQTDVAPPLTPPPTTLEWNEMHTIMATAAPGSPPSIFPSWDPIEDSTKRQSFFGDTGNHSFDSRISTSHGFNEIGKKRSSLGEEELLEETHEGKRMRLSSE